MEFPFDAIQHTFFLNFRESGARPASAQGCARSPAPPSAKNMLPCQKVVRLILLSLAALVVPLLVLNRVEPPGLAAAWSSDSSLLPPKMHPACGSFGPSCWFPGLGRDSHAPTATQCAAGVTNWGDDARQGARSFFLKLRSGEPVTIVAIGGSVTAGCKANKLANQTGATCPEKSCCSAENAWPRQLEIVLRRCGRDATVHSLARAAVGSDYFVEAMRTDSGVRETLATADAVIVEMAVNDARSTRGQLGVEEVTEGLVRRLLQLPKQPFLLWVTASSFRGTWGTSPPEHAWLLPVQRSAEDAHLRVMRHYGLAHISVMRGLGLQFGAAKEHFFFQDVVHPSAVGQQIVAAFLARRLLAWQSKPHAFDGNTLNFTLGSYPLLTEGGGKLGITVEERAERIEFRALPLSRRIKLLEGFELDQDLARNGRKPGLVGTAVGSRLVVRLPSDTSRVALGVLYSYENTGVLRASVLAAAQRHGCSWHNITTHRTAPQQHSPAAHQLRIVAHTKADTLWSTRASLRQGISLPVPAKDGQTCAARAMRALGERAGERCLWLEVEVLESVPARTSNQIKLLDISMSAALDEDSASAKELLRAKYWWLLREKSCKDEWTGCCNGTKHARICPRVRQWQKQPRDVVLSADEAWWSRNCAAACGACGEGLLDTPSPLPDPCLEVAAIALPP